MSMCLYGHERVYAREWDAWACVCVYIYLCAYEGQKPTPDVIPQEPVLLFLWDGLSQGPGVADPAAVVGQEAQTCLCLLGVGIPKPCLDFFLDGLQRENAASTLLAKQSLP